MSQHPSDNPDFKPFNDEPVWYLSHPLAADEKYTFEQNMDHVKHMMRLFFDCGVRVIAPYHTICIVLDDNNAEHRRIGLETDCVVARKLGRIIMCGHKISSGMSHELDNVATVRYGDVLNFVGLKDDIIRRMIKRPSV